MTKRKPVDWPRVAGKIAAAVPMVRLHPGVLDWAARSNARAEWGVAFSGGADSVALLLLLWAHWPDRRAHLKILHFNHRLRGRASNADEKFCAKVCAALGVKLVRGAWARAPRAASEAESRAARMAFFAKHARVVWLGHQQDDIAETLFMRLARGSGSAGLAAPRPVQLLPHCRAHLRPLLTLQKREIVAALRFAGANWQDDETNSGDLFFRNRLRRTVLPAWCRAAQRDALAGAARSRELLEEDDMALEARVDELSALAADRSLQLGKLAGQPRAILRRALHRWLQVQPRAGELVRQGFDALLRAVERAQPTRHSLGREGFAVIRSGALRFERAERKR
jgi:tRNA(Ile)-lysidine synthase